MPYRFANEELSVRITARTVEVFRKGERIAAHQRNSGNHKHTTVNEHMPSSHRRFADWTIERLRRQRGGRPWKPLAHLVRRLPARRHCQR